MSCAYSLSGGALTAGSLSVVAVDGGEARFEWTAGTLSVGGTISLQGNGVLALGVSATLPNAVYIYGGTIDVAEGCTVSV